MSRHITTAVAIAAGALLTLVGCGSKKAAETTTPSGSATAQQAPAAKTETATGELRDALLALHRVHFGYDSSTLLDEAKAAVTEAATKLAKHPTVHIYIDGHSDERGTSEYNIALGEQRARVVADYMTRLGIATERLHVLSFGEEKPLADGQGSTAMATNRRADFRLMRGEVELVLEAGVRYTDKGVAIPPAAPAPVSP